MPCDSLAYRLTRTPGQQRAALNLGEHTEEVLCGLLGLCSAEIERLRRAEILYSHGSKHGPARA
jgi:crotonobetainyl-CoA:carnitine CoA-transferase CaiB-like acyl-CoA transferase